MDDLLSTPPRAPALTSPSWISYSPDLTPPPVPVKTSPTRSYSRPKPSAYKAEVPSTLPKLAPPLPSSARRAQLAEEDDEPSQEGNTSLETEGEWRDVEEAVFGGERFSNVFVLSSSPTSSEGSSEEGAPGFGRGAESTSTASPPTSNVSTPTNSSVVESSPFGDSHAMQVDHVDAHFVNEQDEPFPFPLPEWCSALNKDLLSPSSATSAVFAALSYADDSDMTPFPLTPHHLTRQRDAATAAWEAELYATLGSPSPKQQASSALRTPASPASRRSRSGATTPRTIHPFHYSRTSPLHSPARSPTRGRKGFFATKSNRSSRARSSTTASSSSAASALPPSLLHSPIRLQRPLQPLSPHSPSLGSANGQRRSKSKAAKAERRQLRLAAELAAKPIQIDMVALDAFFGVSVDQGKAMRGGYGGLGLESGREGGWKWVGEFKSLLGAAEEEEEQGEIKSMEGRRRRPPPLDLSRARPRSRSVSCSSDDVSDHEDDMPMSAQTIATGSPWRGVGDDSIFSSSSTEFGDPISREIRRRSLEEGDLGRRGGGLCAPTTAGLRKKKSVADLFKGLLNFGESAASEGKGKGKA